MMIARGRYKRIFRMRGFRVWITRQIHRQSRWAARRAIEHEVASAN